MTVQFDDESVADFYDGQVDAGLQPEQFGRIWLHTHPGDCPEPSITDEDTFDRCFGNVDWAVMFILAKGGKTFSRLRFNVGPQTVQRMKVKVDYSLSFGASGEPAWLEEYETNVFATPFGGHRHRDLEAKVIGCHFDEEDEDWLNRFESDPQFLDWEDDACPQRLSTIPA